MNYIIIIIIIIIINEWIILLLLLLLLSLLSLANTQNIVSKVSTIIAKCTGNLVTAREKDSKKIDLDEMVSFHTDALALLGHWQYELSLKRR